MNKKEYAAQYYRKNKEKMLKCIHKHQGLNKEKNYERSLEYKRSHPERTLECTKRYQASPKGRYADYRCGARKRDIPFNLTFEEFMTFWKLPCSYCKDPIETIGLDRIDSNLGYVISNLIPCCGPHNLMKNNYSSEEFILLCNKVAKVHPR